MATPPTFATVCWPAKQVQKTEVEPHFREVMSTILVEAREGAFATKSAAVNRRGELLAKLKADTAQVRDIGCLIGRLVGDC